LDLRLLGKSPSKEDRERASKLLSYMQKSKLLDHKEILLIDTGFNGTVVRNLREIIRERFPSKQVKMMLICPNPGIGRDIETLPMGLSSREAANFVQRLEPKPVNGALSGLSPHSSTSITSAGVKVGFGFKRWGKEAWRPDYERSNKESICASREKHQQLAKAVKRYLARVKAT
ncbi:MAG: hypothetical protein V1644_02545, partial [Candidatus Micrarchaeota archaeon]